MPCTLSVALIRSWPKQGAAGRERLKMPCDADRPARIRAPASTSSASDSQKRVSASSAGTGTGSVADMPAGHGIRRGLRWRRLRGWTGDSGSMRPAWWTVRVRWLRSACSCTAVRVFWRCRSGFARMALRRSRWRRRGVRWLRLCCRGGSRFARSTRGSRSGSGIGIRRRGRRTTAATRGFWRTRCARIRGRCGGFRRNGRRRWRWPSLQRRLAWLVEDRSRLESRLRSELWEFYPEFETMVTGRKVGLATEWVLALLERLPRPGSVRGVRDATIRKALKRARKVDAAGVRAALSVPTTASEARIEAGAAAAGALRGRLLATVREIAALERERQRLLDELMNAPGEAPARAVREPGPAGSEGSPGEAPGADSAANSRRPAPARRGGLDRRPLRTGAGRGSRTALRRMAARHRPRPRRRHPRHPPRQRRRRPPTAKTPGAAMPVRNRSRHPPVRKDPTRRPTRSRRPRPAQRHVPLRTRRQGQRPRPESRIRPPPPARTPRRPRLAKGRRLHPPLRLRNPPKPAALEPIHPTAPRRLTEEPQTGCHREQDPQKHLDKNTCQKGRESSPPGPVAIARARLCLAKTCPRREGILPSLARVSAPAPVGKRLSALREGRMPSLRRPAEADYWARRACSSRAIVAWRALSSR